MRHIPVRCGHRGSGRGPGENTLASFQAAVRAGLGWVEVDANRAPDGALVASHDPVTDGAGLMRVAELFDALPPHVGIDVDLKSSLADAALPRERTTAAMVAELVRDAGRPVMVTSFDPAGLLIVREHVPEVPIGLLTWIRFPVHHAIPAAAHLGADMVIPHVSSLEPDAIRAAHAAGLRVGAWCPDADEEAALAEAGVDFVVVDDVLSSGPSPTPRTRA
jgi:glycerophosphoryl diester phosphodiesterase